MSATGLLFGSIVLSCIGALCSLACSRAPKSAKVVACIFGVVSAIAGLMSATSALTGAGIYAVFSTPFSFAPFSTLINPLSALMVFVLSLLALVAWIYGFNYFDEYLDKGMGNIGFFMNTFIASMNVVITTDNAFWFLVFFELMSLTSYFLVIVEQTEASIRGGFMYLVVAHAGFVCIMISFFIMASATGSFEFAAFRAAGLSPTLASLVFVLAFIGFGCKAGMVPFHSWLPLAHPAAPSNVSALMSGGMIKIGVFGIVKVGMDLLQSSPIEVWWGILVLIFGAISSVLGVVYALGEHDIKRLLAYHSVENIGIILLGVGAGFVGVALQLPLLAILGFMAGLYHLLNHAVFKGLLFLGAGSVMDATHTRNMEKMGGLLKRMPVTGVCFLIGSLAISAIPPLNGFVSEWFTYQSLFNIAVTGGPVLMIVGAACAVALAITGALAVTCFVKAFGVTFLSAPRSEAADAATESGAGMKTSMVILAIVCVCLGVGAFFVTPVMQAIASSLVQVSAESFAYDGVVTNPILGSALSTFVICALMVVFFLIALALRSVLSQGKRTIKEDPWACGYHPDEHMPVVATSFAAQVHMFLEPLYGIRDGLSKQKGVFVNMFNSLVAGTNKAQNVGDKYIVNPGASLVEIISMLASRIEGGDFRLYIVYIVVALALLLVFAWAFV